MSSGRVAILETHISLEADEYPRAIIGAGNRSAAFNRRTHGPWNSLEEKQNQLNEGLEQQAELAALVFDRWLDAQYQPLKTIASYPPNHLNDNPLSKKT